jgi:membrane-bound lytic murein transglycosylase B
LGKVLDARRTLAVMFGVLLVMLSGDRLAAADDSGRAFFESVQKRLIADGFDPAYIQQLYASDQVFFETRGITQYFQHRESKVNYDSMLHPALIEEGRQYMRTHAEPFSVVQGAFSVDPTVITAIILVETKFGRYLGNKAIINTLSTMAALVDPDSREYLWSQIPEQGRYGRSEYDRKADQKAIWAYKELKAFLTYAQSHQIDPTVVVGSYAGAMGIAQFMPSNILAYGRDGDGDGRINLFVDADAIHSIASYLSRYGWKPGLSRDEAYKVVYHYNHSSYYVNTVLKIADLLAS